MYGVSGDHRLGFSTLATCMNSYSPFAPISWAVSAVETTLPSRSRILVASVQFATALLSFLTRVFTWTLADASDTWGVVTNVPQCATCRLLAPISQTWREIPEPGYQRELGCLELSTFTAIALSREPKTRCGVMSCQNV